MYEIVKKDERKYFKLKLISIKQKNNLLFFGKMPAKDFLNLYTVEPAEYDIDKQVNFASEFKDDEEYYNYLITEDKTKVDSKPFQRKESQERVKDIVKFIKNEEHAIFPNTIIVTCDLLNDDYFDQEDKKFSDLKSEQLNLNSAFLEKNNDEFNLYIPYKNNTLLVIDGQHRLLGLKAADAPLIEEYELLLTFIIGFDRAVVAKLFYTINYTQKSVNKSLLYHLMGEFSKELDKVTFLHGVVKILNEIKDSPLLKRIKMLGYVPKNLSLEIKNNLTLSQAFLIDYLTTLLSKDAVKSLHAPIFLYYYIKEDKQIEIVKFLITYFNAVKQKFEKEWNEPSNYILTNTIGIGALIKLLPFLYVKLFIDKYNYDAEKIIKITSNDLSGYLSGMEKMNFSKKKDEKDSYEGISGAGSLNNLKKEFIKKIVLFSSENKDYDDFIKDFKINYLQPYQKWLTKNI